jgi:hypothetical protein
VAGGAERGYGVRVMTVLPQCDRRMQEPVRCAPRLPKL